VTFISGLLPGLDAYPDVHPMIVHFPVALFPVALLYGVLAFWRGPHLLGFVRWLVWLGTTSAAVAVATGLAAADRMPHGPGTLVHQHRTIMLVAAVLATGISLAMYLARRRGDRRTRGAVVAALVVLNSVLVIGADRGALVALRFHASLGGELPSVVEPREWSTRNEGAAVEHADAGRGQRLYESLVCAGCHEPPADKPRDGTPPELAASGSRYQAAWVQTYLQRPHRRRWSQEGVRPILRMPDFQLGPSEAGDLAAFLATKLDSAKFPTFPPVTARDGEMGRELFRQYSCRGCHRLGGTGGLLGPELDGVGSRLTPSYMYAFLKNPRGVVPGTAMKDFDLWDEEARQLVAYLSSLAD
jgi:nitric oxide reductase subunit C